MHVIKCLIVDDEPLAREALADYCKELSFLQAVGVCKNALQAQVFLEHHHVDVLFLDIQMPLITGIEWLKTQEHPPLTIITTAYSEYALESYAFNVIDYLVKPISFIRFKQAALKTQRLLTKKEDKNYIFVKQDKEIKKIAIRSILFIEAQQNYVRIVAQTTTVITHTTLKGIKTKLPESLFIQIHKSYIAAIHHIDSIKNHEVFIKNYKLPLSTRLKKKVINALDGM